LRHPADIGEGRRSRNAQFPFRPDLVNLGLLLVIRNATAASSTTTRR
jgi:hypothetical protein